MQDNPITPFNNQNRMQSLLTNFKGPFILGLGALILLTVFFLVTFRVQRVSGTEVGVKVNNITGDISVIAESGTNMCSV